MKLREACINHMQKHKERFSKVSIVERVCDVMQVGLTVMMNIGKNSAGGYFIGVCHSVGGGGEYCLQWWPQAGAGYPRGGE